MLYYCSQGGGGGKVEWFVLVWESLLYAPLAGFSLQHWMQSLIRSGGPRVGDLLPCDGFSPTP